MSRKITVEFWQVIVLAIMMIASVILATVWLIKHQYRPTPGSRLVAPQIIELASSNSPAPRPGPSGPVVVAQAQDDDLVRLRITPVMPNQVKLFENKPRRSVR